MYEIVIKRKTLKSIQKLPEPIQRRLANLVEDLQRIREKAHGFNRGMNRGKSVQRHQKKVVFE